MINKKHTDNHSGPNAAQVMGKHPDAIRARYSNSFFPNMRGWRIGYPIKCGGGSGIKWVKVDNGGNPIKTE